LRERDVTIRAEDGRQLAATLVAPDAPTKPPVLIGSATAVRRGYYAKFARFLAERGHAVLTYDYRGVGGSALPDLRADPARMHEWGVLDLEAAIRTLKAEAGGPLLYVGHSVGGQILPLAESRAEVSALLLVASQSGAARHWRGWNRVKLAAFWYGWVPSLLPLFGHLPGFAMGSEPLPRGVAAEWARWGRHPDYILSHRADLAGRFRELDRPIHAFSFTDDFYCPREAADALLSWYGGTEKTHRHVAPAELGARSVGHFGFFRERFRDTLWTEAAAWLASPGRATAGAQLTGEARDRTLAPS